MTAEQKIYVLVFDILTSPECTILKYQSEIQARHPSKVVPLICRAIFTTFMRNVF